LASEYSSDYAPEREARKIILNKFAHPWIEIRGRREGPNVPRVPARRKVQRFDLFEHVDEKKEKKKSAPELIPCPLPSRIESASRIGSPE